MSAERCRKEGRIVLNLRAGVKKTVNSGRLRPIDRPCPHTAVPFARRSPKRVLCRLGYRGHAPLPIPRVGTRRIRLDKAMPRSPTWRWRISLSFLPTRFLSRTPRVRSVMRTRGRRSFSVTRVLNLPGMNVEDLVPERFRGRHPSHRENYNAHPRARQMGAAMNLFGLRKDGTRISCRHHAEADAHHQRRGDAELCARCHRATRGHRDGAPAAICNCAPSWRACATTRSTCSIATAT